MLVVGVAGLRGDDVDAVDDADGDGLLAFAAVAAPAPRLVALSRSHTLITVVCCVSSSS